MSCADSEVKSTLSSHRSDYESSHNQTTIETRDTSGPCIDFQPDERWHIEEDEDSKSKLQQPLKFQDIPKDKNDQNTHEHSKTCKCYLVGSHCKCKSYDCVSEDLNNKSAFGNGKVPVLLQADASKESMKFNGDVDKQFETNISTSGMGKILPELSQTSVLSISAQPLNSIVESKEKSHDIKNSSEISEKLVSRNADSTNEVNVLSIQDGDRIAQSLHQDEKNICEIEDKKEFENVNENSVHDKNDNKFDEKSPDIKNCTEIKSCHDTENAKEMNEKEPCQYSKDASKIDQPQYHEDENKINEKQLCEYANTIPDTSKTSNKSETENDMMEEEYTGHNRAVSMSDNSNQSGNVFDSGKGPVNEESSSNLSGGNSREEQTNQVAVESVRSPNLFSEDSKSEKTTDNSKHFEDSDKIENDVLIVNNSCDKENDMPEVEMIEDEFGNETKLPPNLENVVKVGKFIPVKIPKSGNFKLGENESLLECPSLVTPLLLLKEPTKYSFPIDKPPMQRSSRQFYRARDYFNSTPGKLLMSLGLSRVKEWYHKDMIRLKDRQIKREGKNQLLVDDRSKHEEAYMASKQANKPFTFPILKCELCPFNTDSATVLEGHYLMPHITSRREFRCSYCVYLTRDPKSVMFHYEAIHNKKAVLEPPAQFYECPYCPFETNLKTKANAHINRCQKTFLFLRNQSPLDFDFPGVTAKLINVTDIKHYEMTLTNKHGAWGDKCHKMTCPSAVRGNSIKQPSRQLIPAGSVSASGVPLYQHLASTALNDASTNAAIHKHNQQIVPGIQLPSGLVITRPKFPTVTRPPIRPPQASVSLSVPPRQIFQVVNTSGQIVPVLEKKPLNSQLPWLSSIDSTVTQSNSGPQPVALFPNIAAGGTDLPNMQSAPKAVVSVHQISPAGTQLPRLQGPYPPQGGKITSPLSNILAGSRFVICEICDGYIKDLDQLRIHMQLIHKVKIHPKMLASRPPLNCQKCQWRFFTDQGLERHLLGAHGLVTSNMQDMANKNQDSGRCTICGGVYACKLVAHMNQVHKITLKPAHLSYKCTVCTATFNLYKLFETHVYTAHSGAMKRPTEDSSQNPVKKAAVSQVARKVTPQTTEKQDNADSSSEDESDKEKSKHCSECGIETDNLLSHLSEKHIKECYVKLCRIEKCEKCLCSFDGLVVLHTSDFGLDDDIEDD